MSGLKGLGSIAKGLEHVESHESGHTDFGTASALHRSGAIRHRGSLGAPAPRGRTSRSNMESLGQSLSAHDMSGRPMTGRLSANSSPYHSASSSASSSTESHMHYGAPPEGRHPRRSEVVGSKAWQKLNAPSKFAPSSSVHSASSSASSSATSLHYNIPEHQPRRSSVPGSKAWQKLHGTGSSGAGSKTKSFFKALGKKLDPFSSLANVQSPGAHTYASSSASSSHSSVHESRWDNGHMADHAPVTPSTGGYGEGRFDRR